MTILPFNPSLAHFIFSLSDIAMVETIVGRFSGSKTVRTVLTQSGEEITETQFREEIRRIDCAMIDDYSQRLKTQTKPLSEILKGDYQCSYLAAQHLREDLWGIKMTGITMPAAHEQCSLIKYDDTPSVADTVIILVKPHSNMNIIRGSTNPYIG